MSLVLVAHIIRLQKMPSSKLVPPLFCRNLVLKGSFFPEIFFFFFFNIRSDVLVTISVGQCCFHLLCLLSCFRLPVSVGKVIATSHCIHLYLLCFIMSACFLCNLGIRACCCHLWMTNWWWNRCGASSSELGEYTREASLGICSLWACTMSTAGHNWMQD